MKLKPTYDNILIEKLATENKTSGGIILPDSSGEVLFPITARVRDVGEGRVTPLGVVIPPEVSPGDEVVITKFSGSKVEVNGENLHLLPETEILAIIVRD